MSFTADCTSVFQDQDKLDQAKSWNGTRVSERTSWLLRFSLSLDLLSYEPLLLLKLFGSFLSQTGNLEKTKHKKTHSNVRRQTWLGYFVSHHLVTSGRETSANTNHSEQRHLLVMASIVPTFLSHAAINSRPSRTRNTCPDSTQKHARYFY